MGLLGLLRLLMLGVLLEVRVVGALEVLGPRGLGEGLLQLRGLEVEVLVLEVRCPKLRHRLHPRMPAQAGL